MGETLSERRMAENQVIFRKNNEKVQKDFDDINKIAAEEGEQPVLLDGNTPLYFYCECSDNNCRKRIKVSPNAYNRMHKARDSFMIVRGHEVPKIEDIISKEAEYCVVKKHETPPQNVGKLNDTDVNNV